MSDQDVAANTEPQVETPVPMNETPVDGPGSGRSVLRKQLETNVETARKADQRQAPPRQRSRARQEMEAQEQEVQPTEAEQQEQEAATQTQTGIKVPEGWAKEAKAQWENLPPEVQQAVAKRETDMAKGVEALKGQYKELDQALAPRLDVIKRHGHTPAQAVNQLFAWFEALSGNPHVAFPALANSFKFDLRTIPGLLPLQQQVDPRQQAAQEAQQKQQPVNPEDIPQGVQQYINTLNQKIEQLQQGFSQQIGQLSSSFSAQSQAKTEEILANWAKGKPYFEDVRRMMAHLISSQAVPPLPNGSADLDRAYDMAMYAMPEVRTRVLEDQQNAAAAQRKQQAEAERKAQSDQAAKARRAAAGALAGGAPGSPVLPGPKGKKGKTVRESLEEARQELAE